MKVAITGGHLTPALGVIDELPPDTNIIFIGRKYAAEGDKTKSAEAVVIPNLKIPFFPIEAGRLQRRFTRYTIPALLKIPLGFFQAFSILIKNDPDVILSFGGYVALPVVIAGWMQRIPIVTHEQTTETGLANKIISHFSARICVSWETSISKFPKKKVIVTGNPIRKELLTLKRPKETKPTLYITGGNQGAHVLNTVLEEIVEPLTKNWDVYHQTGSSEVYHDYERIVEKLKTLPFASERYHLAKWYSTTELAAILEKATLVICRSGANTVTELAYLGIPAIFIPLPWSGDGEQTKNAKVLSDLGAAKILLQEELTGKRLLGTIELVSTDLNSFQKKAAEARKLIRPDAASRIAGEVIKIASVKA